MINPTMGTVGMHRHFQLDACPATMVTLSSLPGEPRGQTLLMVYEPKRGNVYVLGGAAAIPDTDSANSEIKAILNSFHVETVAASPTHHD